MKGVRDDLFEVVDFDGVPVVLAVLDEVLVDPGGVQELSFKKNYLESLKKYKNIFTLVPDQFEKKIISPSFKSIDPIQAMVKDLNKDIRREGFSSSQEMPEKTKQLLLLMLSEELDSGQLLQKSGMIPKDFGDHLERLKMMVKKCH
jgi:hypothetical protein